MTILLWPVEVVRGEYGSFIHPELDRYLKTRGEEIATKAEWNQFLQQHNLEAAAVYFENDAPEDVRNHHFGEDCPDFSRWNPTMPDGDGWFILSIHETEDSHICWWVRQIETATNDTEPFISVDLLNQFKQDMISQGYGSFYSFDTFDNGNFKDSNTKTLFVGWRVANAKRTELQAEVDRLKSEPTDKEINVALEAFHRNFRDDPAQDMRFAIKALMKEKEQNHDC